MPPKVLKEKKKKKANFDDKVVHSETVPDDAAFVEYLVIPPDGGWGWVVTTAAFLSNSIVDGIIFSVGTFLTEIAKDLNVKESVFVWANSMMCALYFLAGPIVCAMTNRLGFRIVGSVGGASAACAMLTSSFAPNFGIFFATFGVWLGCSFSMTYLSNILAVGFYFNKWRPIALAVCVTGSGVGTVVVPLIMTSVLSDYDWRMKFKCLSGALCIVSLLGLTFRPIAPVMITSTEKNAKKVEEMQSMMSMSVTEENPKSIFYKKNNNEFPTHADVTNNTEVEFYAPARRDNSGALRSMSRMGGLQAAKTYDPVKSSLSKRSMVQEKTGCCKCRTQQTSRPMYRDDILYTGSVFNFQPLADEEKDESKNIDYHMSVTRIATMKDRDDENKCCLCCPEAVKRTLATMFDFSLLKLPSFTILVISGFLTYLGLYIPYVYILMLGVDNGMSAGDAGFLISTIGIANTIGRFSTGLLVMAPNVKALLITELALILSGVAVGITAIFHEPIAFYVCASVFGFNISCIASLRPIIAVEMVGLENLTNAFGLVVLFEGFASLVGLPVAGIVKDNTDGFLITFVFGGTCIILSAIILFPIPALIKYEKRKAENREKSERERVQKYTKEKLAAVNKPQSSKKPVKV